MLFLTLGCLKEPATCGFFFYLYLIDFEEISVFFTVDIKDAFFMFESNLILYEPIRISK